MTFKNLNFFSIFYLVLFTFFDSIYLFQQYKHNKSELHKGKDTKTAPETGEADLGAAEDCNDNNHDDTATVTVKNNWFADTKTVHF